MHYKQRIALTDAGAAAVTRLHNGHYMVMVFGNDSENVEAFISSQAALPEFAAAK